MPIFHVKVVLATGGKEKSGYYDVPDMTLEEFYDVARERVAKRHATAVARFDCVQISERSHVAVTMRQHGVSVWPRPAKNGR